LAAAVRPAARFSAASRDQNIVEIQAIDRAVEDRDPDVETVPIAIGAAPQAMIGSVLNLLPPGPL